MLGFLVSLIVAIVIGLIGGAIGGHGAPGSMVIGFIGAWIGHGLFGTWGLILRDSPSFRRLSEPQFSSSF